MVLSTFVNLTPLSKQPRPKQRPCNERLLRSLIILYQRISRSGSFVAAERHLATMDVVETKDQSDDFYLLSAIRYDTEIYWRQSKQPGSGLDVDFESPLFLITYHLDFLVRGGEAFGWEKAVESLKGDEALGRFRKACEEKVTGNFPDKTKDGKPASYKVSMRFRENVGIVQVVT